MLIFELILSLDKGICNIGIEVGISSYHFAIVLFQHCSRYIYLFGICSLVLIEGHPQPVLHTFGRAHSRCHRMPRLTDLARLLVLEKCFDFSTTPVAVHWGT